MAVSCMVVLTHMYICSSPMIFYHDIVIVYGNLISVVVVDKIMLFTHLILYLKHALHTEFP